MISDLFVRVVALGCAAALFFMAFMWFNLVSEMSFNSDWFAWLIILVGGAIGLAIGIMGLICLALVFVGEEGL